MQIVLSNLKWADEANYLASRPEISDPPWLEFKDFLKPFANEPDKPPVLCPGYCSPATAAAYALNWAWVKWHLDEDIDAIRRNLSVAVERGLKLHTTEIEAEREKFDYLMIWAAVLSGDRLLMRRAAESVWYSGRHLDHYSKYQYYQALSGIMRFHILGDQRKQREQFARFINTGPVPYLPVPGKALLRRLVERDYKAFARQVKIDCEKYNKHVQRERTSLSRAVVEKTDDRIVIDLTKRIGRYYWPWPEAGLAKLAIIDGAKISYDSTWFPLELVSFVN